MVSLQHHRAYFVFGDFIIGRGFDFDEARQNASHGMGRGQLDGTGVARTQRAMDLPQMRLGASVLQGIGLARLTLSMSLLRGATTRSD